MDNSDYAKHWHLDKRVPITIIIAFVCQTLVLVYIGTSWKNGVDSRLASLEKIQQQQEPQERRLIIVEEKVNFISESVRRIENVVTNPAAR